MLTFLARGKRQTGRIVVIAVAAVLWLGQALGQAATHTVKRGETLGVIAKKYGLSASALAAHNGIANPNKVKIGRKLIIPAKTETLTYTIRKGDTLSTIANKYKTTAAAIAKANEIDDRPVVIDFRVSASEKVYPMVPSGATNSELLVPPFQQDQPR